MLFSKAKVKYPEEYQIYHEFNPNDFGLSDDSMLIVKGSESMSANCIISNITNTNWEPMPFDNLQKVIDDCHSSISDNQGIIEAGTGQMFNGGKYVYLIRKQGRSTDNEPAFGMDYLLNMNFSIDEKMYFVDAAFFEEGTTGVRDSLGMNIFLNIAEEKAKENGEEFDSIKWIEEKWFRDPYDESFTNGILMNLSEVEELDDTFPQHPLSELRKMKNYIINNN